MPTPTFTVILMASHRVTISIPTLISSLTSTLILSELSVEDKMTNYTPADLQATIIIGLFVLVCICFVALVHVFDTAARRQDRIRRRIIREDYDAMQRWRDRHDWM